MLGRELKNCNLNLIWFSTTVLWLWINEARWQLSFAVILVVLASSIVSILLLRLYFWREWLGMAIHKLYLDLPMETKKSQPTNKQQQPNQRNPKKFRNTKLTFTTLNSSTYKSPTTKQPATKQSKNITKPATQNRQLKTDHKKATTNPHTTFDHKYLLWIAKDKKSFEGKTAKH